MALHSVWGELCTDLVHSVSRTAEADRANRSRVPGFRREKTEHISGQRTDFRDVDRRSVLWDVYTFHPQSSGHVTIHRWVIVTWVTASGWVDEILTPMLAEFRSWAPRRTTFVSEDAPTPLKRLSKVGLRPPPHINSTLMKFGRGKRAPCLLSFHYQHVGRRPSFRFFRLHTAPTHRRKSLKLLFYNNFKTIITLCVTNVQRKKIVGIFWGLINLLMICSYLIVGFSLLL